MTKIFNIIIWVGLLGILSGCSKEEILKQSSERGISFETHIGKSTKATPKTVFETGDIFTATCITSAAQWGEIPATIPGDANFVMSNIDITKGATGWGYDKTIYWDKDKYHSFFAYSPKTNVTNENNLKISFNVATHSKVQTDFLIAKPVFNKQYTANDVNLVKFEFCHALCQVKFSARLAHEYPGDNNITINTIKIQDLINTGSTSLSTMNENGYVKWESGTPEPGAYHEMDANSSILLTTSYQSVTKADGAFMLLPQTLNNNNISISYQINGNTEKTASVTIPSGQWVNNNIYHYYITLDLSGDLGKPIIIGDPVVIEWEKDAIESLDPPTPIQVQVEDAIEGINGSNDNTRFTVIKPNKGNQIIKIKINDPSSLTWEAAKTQYEGQPMEWLKMSTNPNGQDPNDNITGTGDGVLYVTIPTTQASEAKANRTAIIKITPTSGSDTNERYISITQEFGKDIIYMNDKDGKRYDIYTAKGLKLFADSINNNSARTHNGSLKNNINLTPYQANDGWTPIGINTPYKGIFKGNGKTISALKINNIQLNGIGLFGVVELGVIMNLNLTDASITANKKAEQSVGTIAGIVKNGALLNCSSSDFIINANGSVGGLVGEFNMYANPVNNQPKGIVSCTTSSGKITLPKDYAKSATSGIGGVVGSNLGSLVFCCYGLNNTITDNSTISDVKVGGVVGINRTHYESKNAYVSASVVTDCYSWNESGNLITTTNANSITGNIVGSIERPNNNGVPMVSHCATNGSKSFGYTHPDAKTTGTISSANAYNITNTVIKNNQTAYTMYLPDKNGDFTLTLMQMWNINGDLPKLHWE